MFSKGLLRDVCEFQVFIVFFFVYPIDKTGAADETANVLFMA